MKKKYKLRFISVHLPVPISSPQNNFAKLPTTIAVSSETAFGFFDPIFADMISFILCRDKCDLQKTCVKFHIVNVGDHMNLQHALPTV